ncbi:MAG: GLPGLI family protein [Bacteroidales bacterium]|nr:GLPGLI family protein [Bacteroidales bacterium]
MKNQSIKISLILMMLIAALANTGKAQPVEGRIRYLKTSNWTKMISAVDYLSKQQRERVTYMWGSRSEWKQYTEMYLKPGNTFYKDSEEQAEADDDGYSWRRDEYSIWRNFNDGRIIDMIQLLGKVYIIEDTLKPQNWKILNDIKEVAGHICMNASWYDSLKQQSVIAWFAMDMPISGGPERFCGLPGLILEVDINDGAMVITADKIELKPITTEMDLPKKMKGKHVHEHDYFAVLQKHMKERKDSEEPPFWGIRY